ncbi:hypothetical protein E3P78_00486 [Wallemia ichthyophaga]|nr:hypothetical protein E3P78_00486 [Wallemia ichthyophaga]
MRIAYLASSPKMSRCVFLHRPSFGEYSVPRAPIETLSTPHLTSTILISCKARRDSARFGRYFKIAVHSTKETSLFVCAEDSPGSDNNYFIWDTADEWTMPFEFTTQAARMRDAHPTFNASWARLESVKHLGRSANAENNQKSKRVEIEETNFMSSLFNGKEYGEACCNHAMACSGARHEAVKSILEHSRARKEAIGKPLGLLFAKSRPKRQENVCGPEMLLR